MQTPLCSLGMATGANALSYNVCWHFTSGKRAETGLQAAAQAFEKVDAMFAMLCNRLCLQST